MMIRFQETLTVSEFLESIKRRYKDEENLRMHVKKHPRDIRAKLDLEDFEYYAKRPDMIHKKIQRAVSLIPVTDEALAMFTAQRLKMLDILQFERFESVRQLAEYLGRDVRNVYDDLRRFRSLGILDLEPGPRNSRIPRLLADAIVLTPGK